MKRLGVCLLLASATAAPVFAWGDGGHETVAAIAYVRLNPTARKEVDRLLSLAPPLPGELPNDGSPQNARTRFWHAAHWPDDVKKTPQFIKTSDEHFQDMPFAADGTKLPTDLPKGINVTEALNRYVDTLQNSKDDGERGVALRFIIHLVGDIHQPLHCATRVSQAHPEGDMGGNLFPVKTRGAGKPELHSYWDGGLGTFPPETVKTVGGKLHFFPPSDRLIPPKVTEVLNGNPATDSRIAAKGPRDFDTWQKESTALAQSTAYAIRENTAPSSSYNTVGIGAARQRVAWAGYRLAALLNDILKSPSGTLTPASAGRRRRQPR